MTNDQQYAAYDSSNGATFIVQYNLFRTGNVFYREPGIPAYHKIVAEDHTGAPGSMSITLSIQDQPFNYGDGNQAVFDADFSGFTWNSRHYLLQHELVNGPSAFVAPEDNLPRASFQFMTGINDGSVVYVSRYLHGVDYRVFIGVLPNCNQESGTLQRVEAWNVRNYRDDPRGSCSGFRADTPLGGVYADDGTWKHLNPKEYDIVETPTEVTYTRKK